jgi:hypothetical protein
MNSSMPVRTIAIGAPTRPRTVRARGFGVVVPNAANSATKDNETLAAGHPAETKKAEAIANHAAARTPLSAAVAYDRYRGARQLRSGHLPDLRATRFWRTWSSRRSNSLAAHAEVSLSGSRLVRAACNSATSATIALRAAALLTEPLLDSSATLVTSGRSAIISRNSVRNVVALPGSPRRAGPAYWRMRR